MIPRLSRLLLHLFWFRMVQKYVIRDFHPLIFFYALGAIMGIPGLLFGLSLLVTRVFLGLPVAETSALFAALLTIMGIQFSLFAMLFDMEYNSHLKR